MFVIESSTGYSAPGLMVKGLGHYPKSTGLKMKNKKLKPTTSQLASANSKKTSRRRFLRAGAGTGIFSATTLGASRTAHARYGLWDFLGIGGWFEEIDDVLNNPPFPGMTSLVRAKWDHKRRVEFCDRYLSRASRLQSQPRSTDESELASQRYYASFSKCLPSNDRGEVDPSAFEALVESLSSDRAQDIDDITLDSTSSRKLANPQGAFQFQSYGMDGHASRMPASHSISSPELAGEMVEVYWQALTRDIPFEAYSENSLVDQAVQDLNRLSVTPASQANGAVNPESLFRGETPGDLQGPYISQFLWKDYSFGSIDVVQKYQTPRQNQDFMQLVPEWLRIQRGEHPSRTIDFEPQKRFIFNSRSLAEYVHRDVSFQAYQQAALILLRYGPPALAQENPYGTRNNQAGFVSHGAPFILDLVNKASLNALHAAWYQKWVVHRLLRPEAMAGRVHFKFQDGANYDIHEDLLNSDALSLVYQQQGNYLLSQAYPEGSPTHPSYPAGHGCVAGACATVLKALFNESFVIPDPVVATNGGRNLRSHSGVTLTAGGEINKLASNIALGRDAAGVHYRQDGVQGLLLGERVAIDLLREAASAGSEPHFSGFQFTRFDGTTQHIYSDLR